MDVSSNVTFTLKIGSKVLDSTRYPVASIAVDKRINRIPYAKIVLQDGSIQSKIFAITDEDKQIFEVGAAVVIEAGYDGKLAQLFKGVIAKLAIHAQAAAGTTFTVTCRDIAYKTTLTPKTVHFEKCKDSDFFKKILGNYSGLSSKLEATDVVHECITQHEISDWDFINLRAEANGQIVVVQDGTISIKKPATSGRGVCTYTYGVDIINFKAEIDSKDQWEGAAVRVWDSSQQRVMNEKAEEAGEQSMGAISYKKLTAATKQGPAMLSHSGMLTPPEIKKLATSLLNRRRIAKIKGSLTVNGNAKLAHDHLITIDKGAKNFSGDAYVSGVQHRLSSGIWETTLTLGLDAQRYMLQYHDIGVLPAAGMMAPIHGLQLGIVKQITQDPQKNNRILVHLPLIQDKPQEGIWCRLASFYATKQAGSFIMPELEDEVVVGFMNDDIRFPIILGSLYNGKHTPPKMIDDKNLFKSFVSREKLEFTFHDDPEGPEIIIKTATGGLIQLSDKNKSIEIIDQNSNKIVLGTGGVAITSSKDIHLNAQGNISIQSGKDIVLEGMQNVNIKSMNINAQASMKAILNGNASTEVKSGMATIIKGTTVLIN
ncbi:MAG: type VI secretion system tip protein VgrG [Candidatus Cardinium sp.]|nr:type VI secretion system tip protein VgrG [Candidatus Cardinium sp.]